MFATEGREKGPLPVRTTIRARGGLLDASDADLVRRCLDGERGAWGALLERYGDLVYGIAHRSGHDPSACADVFQEVSIRLWKSLPTLRRRESLVPWLATTAKRVAWRSKARGRARSEREKATAKGEAQEAPEPARSLAAAEEEQAVRTALATLGERCRRLLRALYFDPASPAYDDVARRLGIPRGSIGPTRGRCLERLREALAARGFEAARVSLAAPAASSLARRRREESRG